MHRSKNPTPFQAWYEEGLRLQPLGLLTWVPPPREFSHQIHGHAWCPSLLLHLDVMLNGVLGHHVQHGRGLWQGHPLSPLVFVQSIDPIQNLLYIATEHGVLHWREICLHPVAVPGINSCVVTSKLCSKMYIFLCFLRDLYLLYGVFPQRVV